MRFRAGAKKLRLAELIHREVPYPTALFATQDADTTISLTHKRWAQNEAGKVVLDGDLTVTSLAGRRRYPAEPVLPALLLAKQAKASMLAPYQGWIDSVLALLGADATGSFYLRDSTDQKQRRRQGSGALRTIDAQITALRAASGRASQMARQVEINLQLQRLRRERIAAVDDLQGIP